MKGGEQERTGQLRHNFNNVKQDLVMVRGKGELILKKTKLKRKT